MWLLHPLLIGHYGTMVPSQLYGEGKAIAGIVSIMMFIAVNVGSGKDN